MADLYVCPEHGETNPCGQCRAEDSDLDKMPKLTLDELREAVNQFFPSRLNAAVAHDYAKQLLNLVDSQVAEQGYWPMLLDRSDGVRDHFCVGRLIKPGEIYWEFWNKGRWVSAGEVFVGREVAQAQLDKIRVYDAATFMRSACIEKVREMGQRWYADAKRRGAAFSDKGRLAETIAKELESVTIQEQKS